MGDDIKKTRKSRLCNKEQIEIGIGDHEGNVLILFNSAIRHVSLSPEEAEKLGQSIIDAARNIV